MRTVHFIALIQEEGDGYAALCPELDIASEGNSVEETRLMLTEAVEAFFECAGAEEVEKRLGGPCYIVPLECRIA